MIKYLINISKNNYYKNIFKADDFGYKLSVNLGFNIEWIKIFPDIKWNFFLISQHPNLNISWIYNNPQVDWNYYLISKHSNIDPNHFINLFFYLYNYNFLSDKKYNLNWKYLSLNPNISYNFVESYLEFIDFESLSENNFNGINYQWIDLQKKKKEMIKIFEEELIKKTWHPSRFLGWCLEYNFTII